MSKSSQEACLRRDQRESYQVSDNVRHIGKLMDLVQGLIETCELLNTRIGILEEHHELFRKG